VGRYARVRVNGDADRDLRFVEELLERGRVYLGRCCFSGACPPSPRPTVVVVVAEASFEVRRTVRVRNVVWARHGGSGHSAARQILQAALRGFRSLIPVEARSIVSLAGGSGSRNLAFARTVRRAHLAAWHPTVPLYVHVCLHRWKGCHTMTYESVYICSTVEE
jgi:plasmid stability protein